MQDGDTSSRGPTRRELIAAGSASAIALTTGLGMIEPPVLAAGTVFEDRSGAGRRQRGDPGIAGVMVSNGRDVVLTDAEGCWRLPVAEGDSLFVVKPPHWSTPSGLGAVPRFSYLHQPRGTPGDVQYRHEVIAPTGPLPASIDFPLRRQPESSCFEALLLADTQPENALELAYLREDIIGSILDSGAAFGINHGDVVFDDLGLYPRYLEMLAATGLPWHHCPGNHDINSEARDDGHSRETWKRAFGPRHYAFQYGAATFIVLDNVHFFGHNPGAPRSGRYCGLIGERQLQFVRNVLAHVPTDQLVVLSMHIPLATYQDPESPADNTADRLALLRLLAGRPHTVSFSGHMHLTEHHYLGLAEARPHHHHVLAAACGGWWGGPPDRRGIPFADSPDGNPNGYHVLAVDGSHYSTRFVAAGGKCAGRLRAVVRGPHGCRCAHHSLAPIAMGQLGQCELVVNVFDGGPRTRVAYGIAGRGQDAIPMRRAAACDPFIVELFAQQGSMQKPWVRPVTSSHLWTAPVCADLTPGAHRLTICVDDEYGRRHAAHMILEVAADASPI
jgi:calcineurin-like phosphoesterase family protein